MKRLMILFILTVFNQSLIAQDKNESNEIEVIRELDIPPIILGCNPKMNKTEIVLCLQNKLSKQLVKRLRFSVFQKQNLPNGKYKIDIFFKISKKAKITDIKVKYDNDEIVNEIIRVMKKIKIKNPGIIDGKPVGVKYTLPIYFTLE